LDAETSASGRGTGGCYARHRQGGARRPRGGSQRRRTGRGPLPNPAWSTALFSRHRPVRCTNKHRTERRSDCRASFREIWTAGRAKLRHAASRVRQVRRSPRPPPVARPAISTQRMLVKYRVLCPLREWDQGVGDAIRQGFVPSSANPRHFSSADCTIHSVRWFVARRHFEPPQLRGGVATQDCRSKR
jgi:hypothetical protein